MQRFNIDGFMLAILAMVAFASIFPATGDAANAINWMTSAAIALLFLLYGARLSPQETWRGLRHWRLHGAVLSTTFIVFPLLGLAASVLVPTVLTQNLYTGLLFLCLVPSTVQSSIAFTSIARGNVAGAIVSASVSNLVGVFLTPILVLLLMNTSSQAHVNMSSILDIVLQLLLPFIAGQLLRPLVSGWLRRNATPTKLVDRGSIVLVVYSAFSAGMSEHIWTSTQPWRIVAVGLIVMVMLTLVLALTYACGRLFGFDRGDVLVLLFCGSKKSLAAGLPMAAVLFTGQPVGMIVLPLIIFHQIQLIVCAWLSRRFAAQADKAEQGQPLEGAPAAS